MDDMDSFGDALHCLLSDESDRQRIAGQARAHAVAELGTDVILDRIREYYASVMADMP